MRRETRLMWSAIILLLLAVSLQRTSVFALFGVRPNLTLTSLLVLSFFIPGIFTFGLLTIFFAAALRFMPGLGWEVVALTLVPILGFLARRRLVWHGIVASTFLIATGTLAFYLLMGPRLLLQIPVTFILELFYNVVIGAVIYFIFWRSYGNER